MFPPEPNRKSLTRSIFAKGAVIDPSKPVKILFHKSNEFGPLSVYEQNGIRMISTCPMIPSRPNQSYMPLDDKLAHMLYYSQFQLSSLFLFNPTTVKLGRKPLRVLMLGLGGATTPKGFDYILSRTNAQFQMDCVEINPVMVDVAAKYFHYDTSGVSNHNVYIEDGCEFVKRVDDESYDVVFFDAYDHITIPPVFLTASFFEDAFRILKKGGAFVLNKFGNDASFFTRYQQQTNRFDDIYLCDPTLREASWQKNALFMFIKDAKIDPQVIRANGREWASEFSEIGIDVEQAGGCFMRLEEDGPSPRSRL